MLDDEIKHMEERLDHISMQFDYVSRSFHVAVKALGKIYEHEESFGQQGLVYKTAQKALRSIKALSEEAYDEDEELNI